MKRFHILLWVLFLLAPIVANAGLDDLMKKLASPPQNQKGEKPNKTENLIFSGIKVLQSMAPIGYKEEMAIGGAVALEAVARFGGLWENPEMEKYLARVGSAVVLTSDRSNIPYYFGILNAEEPNAFAAPGGYIFVSKGLLKLVKNEAELGGILGHEIAHVSKKHVLNAIRRSKTLEGLSEVTLSALDQNPKMFDSLVKEVVNTIFVKGLSKEDEQDADATGTDFAFRVGYQPKGLQDFLRVLETVSGKQKGGIFQTHPKPEERISFLANVLKGSEYKGSQSLPLLAERWTTARTASSL